jgi:hypothetical protein
LFFQYDPSQQLTASALIPDSVGLTAGLSWQYGEAP